MRFNKEYKIDKDFQTKYTNSLKIKKEENAKYIPQHVMPILGGNELSILFAHDAIRRYNERTYAYVYKLNKDFKSNHSFTLDSIMYKKDVPIYCISFQYNDNTIIVNDKPVEKLNIKGKIFIRAYSYAIERLEYVSYSLENSEQKNFEIVSDYRIINEKMYLNYLSFSNFFKAVIPPSNYAQYDIPFEKQPLQIDDIVIEENSITLKFNKNLKKSGVLNKNNYKLSGFIVNSDIPFAKPDTMFMPEYPEEVSFIRSNTIKLSINKIHRIFLEEDSKNIDYHLKYNEKNFSLNSNVNAIIENNTINFNNISLSINKLTDEFGNKFNSLYTIDMYQFREFFVNDILKINYTIPQNAMYISNEFPLYNQSPPIIDNFWNQFNFPIITPLLDNTETSSLPISK